MKRFLFVWWWGRAAEMYDRWHDGLRAAIDEVGKTWDVEISLGEHFPEEKNWECVLVWGDSNCKFLDRIDEYNGKKGIILTTDPHNMENLKKLDTVFCESTPVYEEVRRGGLHAIKAFGTDTDFFHPKSGDSSIGYFYPATFSPWKRQRDIAYLGNKLWCVGTVQPDGQEDLKACKETGVNIAEGYFRAEQIRDIYQKAQNVIIPAIHGSERTVLEAMATDILPDVTNPHNIRTLSYLDEYRKSGLISPREFVLKNYSHVKYAELLIKGLT